MREKIIGIYCIENIKNGKKYIGQSIDVDSRLKGHKGKLIKNKHTNKHLQSAFNKYGVKNFSFYLLEICLVEELDDKEKFFIKKLKTHYTLNGYNFSWGGIDGLRGNKFSDESRKRMSDSHIGWVPDKKWREKRRNFMLSDNNPMKGKTQTREVRKRISQKLKGRKMPDETKKKIGYTLAGRKHIKDSSSQYIGVIKTSYNHKYKEKVYFYEYFVARFTLEQKLYHLGSFKIEEDAAKAYDEKSWELYHDLNKLNFPENYIGAI